jgi:sensor histidine kinase YesM
VTIIHGMPADIAAANAAGTPGWVVRPSWAQVLITALVFSLAISLPGPLGAWWVSADGKGDVSGWQVLEWIFQSTVATSFFVTTMLAVLVFGYSGLLRRGLTRRVTLVALALTTTVVGVFSQWIFHVLAFDGALPDHNVGLAYELQRLLSISLLFLFAYDHTQRTRQANDARHQTRLRRLQLERELGHAQLQLLQAQIEPHFLFNTLANLRRLVRTDSPAARAMLADLLRYLAEALPSLRDERSTVARELALVRAYLALHQVRMGERLKVSIDMPEALAGVAIPPMVVLTLVENAIKHGLAPRVEGGEIHVKAGVDHARMLQISVADTGRGLQAGSGHGSGLANLRARLKALYGSTATVFLSANEPQGVVATLVLPAAQGRQPSVRQ